MVRHWLWGAGVEGEILRDDQWERLRDFGPGGREGKRGPRSDGRRFFDAILWLARSGGCWRADAGATCLSGSVPIRRPSDAITAGSRSEEHTSELQSLMRISYAVFCLKKKKKRMRVRARSKKNEDYT